MRPGLDSNVAEAEFIQVLTDSGLQYAHITGEPQIRNSDATAEMECTVQYVNTQSLAVTRDATVRFAKKASRWKLVDYTLLESTWSTAESTPALP